MTDFFLRVDRPEHRHVWRFLDSDADGADVQVEVSIPRKEWWPADTFDKTDKFVEENKDASLNDLTLYVISLFDAEGHKWLKANRKKIPMNALGVMWSEIQNDEGMSEGESVASSAS
ncbi:MAG TPA: hypothetical protein VK053_08405 [Jiangellaceae bacterium]|nr:hypothetical protein [Jiangellaceae bacterium]